MRWKLKALIQQSAAQLPKTVSEAIYFRLQRHCGNLRSNQISPVDRLTIGFKICQQIAEHKRSAVGATFFEIGTGWRLNVPIACWLCGADRIITVDVNRFLRGDLIKEDLRFIRENEASLFHRFRANFGNLIQAERWRELVQLAAAPTVHELRSLIQVEYIAPADAANTLCDASSVDFHVSCNALEHIPPEVLREIFHEASRIVRPAGMLLHQVDHTDHFSHADRTLSPIHFLQFSDTQWCRYAGNRYAYVNRLREDDYFQVFRDCGLLVGATVSTADESICQQLNSCFPLDARFREKSPDVLSRLNSLFVVHPGSSANVASNVIPLT